MGAGNLSEATLSQGGLFNIPSLIPLTPPLRLPALTLEASVPWPSASLALRSY